MTVSGTPDSWSDAIAAVSLSPPWCNAGELLRDQSFRRQVSEPISLCSIVEGASSLPLSETHSIASKYLMPTSLPVLTQDQRCNCLFGKKRPGERSPGALTPGGAELRASDQDGESSIKTSEQ